MRKTEGFLEPCQRSMMIFFFAKVVTGFYCVKSVRIRTYSGRHFPAFSPNAGKC